MVVKRIYSSDKTIQWYHCDTIIKTAANEVDPEKFLLYLDKKLISTIELVKKNKNGFTVYILEDGKTIDTLYWNVNQ